MAQRPRRPAGAVYVISVAAELTGLHPQTLRTYERQGLVLPNRTGGGGRRYSDTDIVLLRRIAELTAEGIGIEGVRRILALERRALHAERQVAKLQAQLADAQAALQVRAPVSPNKLPAVREQASGQEMLVWRRRRPLH